jgi:DnaJ-domain-containing protein 1
LFLRREFQRLTRSKVDCFAILDEPRRPWLDPEALKQKFLNRSAEIHPDRAHGLGEDQKKANLERFAELNQAYQKLREPKDRLEHLLELETGAPPAQIQRVPPQLMDLAMEIGQVCWEADAFLAEKDRTTSPLLRVQIFERSQPHIDQIRAIQARIEGRYEELITEIRRLDADWVAADSKNTSSRGILLPNLEELYRLLSYYDRWRGQLQGRLTRLSF